MLRANNSFLSLFFFATFDGHRAILIVVPCVVINVVPLCDKDDDDNGDKKSNNSTNNNNGG